MAEIIKSNEAVAQAETLEDKVKKINRLESVKLSDTIEMMNSADYKERFIAEYMQLKIRYNSLHKLIVQKEAGTLSFEPTTPILTLKNQKSFMGQYLNQLEIRAEIEQIPLPRI